MLTKETVLDVIEVTEDGEIRRRYATYILEDGKRITDARYNRVSPLEPGQALDANTETRVKDITAVIWDQATIDAYAVKKTARLDAQKIPAAAVPPGMMSRIASMFGFGGSEGNA